MIDPTINIGTIVSVGVSILTAAGFIWAIKTSVSVLETRLTFQDDAIKSMQEEIKGLNTVVKDQAVAAQRMNNFEERLLAQGKRLDEALSWFMKKMGVS